MKYIFILLLTLSFSQYLNAADISRSDSVDIRKITMNMAITDFANKHIQVHAQIDIKSLINGQNSVVFDLESMTVDSIKWNGANTSFSQSGFYLIINTPNTFDQNDTALVDIYYNGTPVQDATWGGFYFVGNYAFQMGVGFNAQPHNFGRTWHPCFDNFVERSAYEFYIETTADKMATSNGIFQDSTLLGNGNILWHYNLAEEIPSYLSAVAVSDYVWVKKQLNGMGGITPAWIAARVADTNNVNGSFANLQSSFDMLEGNFGEHSFSKVGYTLVPFSAGAMEHATNIHIGQAFINGSLTYETLIAHELAHHWWGDLVTCRTAGDMWLNEGWASYAEQLHQEHTYGQASFLESVRANTFSVLSRAHINDDGFKAISPMDSIHTYGSTVYSKGAMAAHSLRAYLGDSLFFGGTTAFLNANKFKDISSEDLRDYLSNYSGKNLIPFFDDWIFQSGFPHFSIDSMQTQLSNGQYEISTFIRHRKREAPNYYTDVPLEIAFYDEQFNEHIYSLTMSNRCMEFKVSLPFEPQMTVLNPRYKIGAATTTQSQVLTGTFVVNMTQSLCLALISSVNNPGDSSLLHVSHHWVAPDRFKVNPGNDFVLHNNRYWEIKGVNLSNLNGRIRFPYNASNSNHYLDSTWLQNTEDNIRLFYRKNATQDWTFANDSLVAGNINDKNGFVFLNEIKAGEYCFGIKRPGYNDPLQSDIPTTPCGLATSVKDRFKNNEKIKIYPNPTKGIVHIKATNNMNGLIELYTLSGQKVFEKDITINQQGYRLLLPNFAKGTYLIKFSNGKQQHSEKIQIQ